MHSVIVRGIFMLIGETDVHLYKLSSAVMAHVVYPKMVYDNTLFTTHPVHLKSGLALM